ncbi:MAG TPA: NnrS family protein [Steroidobacteraceae bacterium]|nr:NnrS family protein [Steroidobacteraceae bacterium]
MTEVDSHPRGALRVLLSRGFRPFFLCAALWAAMALALWLAMLTTGLALPTRFAPLEWHIHEMLFGFVLATVAGFLLTAIPEWTGRQPVTGTLLGVLCGLWLLGRVGALFGAFVPVWMAIAADIAFPAALAVVVAREIFASGQRAGRMMVVPVAVLMLAQLLMDLGGEAGNGGGLDAYGWRLGLAAILIQISVIGGRIVPAFTRNWLVRRGEEPVPPAANTIDRAALAVLHTALLTWVFFPQARLTGVALFAGATVNLWRLWRWRGATTRAEPLLFVLHVGYAWLVLGVAALGFATWDASFPLSAAIHALTVGAIGTMILAVMTRATRGHTGRVLTADRSTTLIYFLVVLAAAVRIVAAFAAQEQVDWLLAAGALWIGAFGLFALRYAPLLLRPRLSTSIAESQR